MRRTCEVVGCFTAATCTLTMFLGLQREVCTEHAELAQRIADTPEGGPWSMPCSLTFEGNYSGVWGEMGVCW